MNDAKFSYNFFAKKNTTDVNNSISALPEGLPKKNFTAPNPAVYDSDKKNTTVQSENEKIVDEIQNNHNRIRSLIKLAVIGAAITILIIISTIAWFTMNREVENTGLSMTATSMPFEIAAYGTEGVRNEGIFSSIAPEYQQGSLTTLSGTTYYATGVGTDAVRLRYSTGESEIGPGESGDLSLYVIPKVDSAFDVTVTLNVVAYAEIEKYTTSVNSETGETEYSPVYKTDENDAFILDENNNKIVDTELVEIKSLADFTTKATAVNNQQAITNAAEYIAAASYLRGHIVFFGGTGDITSSTESARYYYTTPYTTRIINKSIPADNKGKAINVPVYWMWTNTLGQLALPDNVSGKRNGYPVLSDANTSAKSEIVAYLKSNSAEIFANNSGITESNITAVSTHVDTVDDFDTVAFNSLSTGYNEADRLIGTRIAYFLIEVTVSSGN